MTIRNQVVGFMADTKTSMAALAKEAGVSYDTVRDLVRREGSTTSAEKADKIRDAIARLAGESTTPQVLPVGEQPTYPASLIPVYDIAASAGAGAIVDAEEVSHTLAFPPDYLKSITTSHPRNLSIISVKGDSMTPTLHEDDIVMLDMSKTSLGYEGLFVIRIFDALHVKRLSHSRPGHVEVISDNRDKYPPREYPMTDIEVVGKVLWSGGKV